MRVDNINAASTGSAGEVTKPSLVEDGKFQEILNKAIDKKDKAKLLEVCQQFEGYFINQMLQKMRNAIPKEGFFGDDPGEKTFQEMLDDNLSGEMSKAGGFGLAQMMYNQLTKDDIKPQIDQKG